MKKRWIGKILEIGLFVCIIGAVLAFGGTEPMFFAAVQVLAFLLFALVLWVGGSDRSTFRLPWKGPVLLLVYLVVQSIALQAYGHLLQENLLNVAAYLCLFMVTAHICQSERSQRRLLLLLIVLGLFEALYGLMQHLTGWQVIFTYEKIFYTTRASGTYINPNHFAGLLEMILPLSVASVLYRLGSFNWTSFFGHRVRSSLLLSDKFVSLFFALFSSLFLFVGIVFSQSRMGIMSAITAVAVMMILWMSSTLHRSRVFAITVVFVVCASALVFWIGLEPVVQRYGGTEHAYMERLGIWLNTLELIKANPLWGTGLGTFDVVYTQVQTQYLDLTVNHAHNDYLEISSELGIVGATLVFGLILAVLVRTVSAFLALEQNRFRFFLLGGGGSILAILFHSLTDFNLYIPANALVFSVILGLAHSYSKVARRKVEEKAASSDSR